ALPVWRPGTAQGMLAFRTLPTRGLSVQAGQSQEWRSLSVLLSQAERFRPPAVLEGEQDALLLLPGVPALRLFLFLRQHRAGKHMKGPAQLVQFERVSLDVGADGGDLAADLLEIGVDRLRNRSNLLALWCLACFLSRHLRSPPHAPGRMVPRWLRSSLWGGGL